MQRTLKNAIVAVVLTLGVGLPGEVLGAAPDVRPTEVFTNAEAVFKAHGCKARDVLCLDGDGNGFLTEDNGARDALPPNVHQGQRLTVKVVGCQARYQDVEFSIALVGGRSGEQLFRSEVGKRAEELALDEKVTCVDAEDFGVLHSVVVDVPSAASVDLKFERKAAETPPLAGAEASHSARVLRSLYFLDVSIAAPFVIGGKRKISTRSVPSLDASVLTFSEDVHIVPAVMLHVFPGGRRLGAISSFGFDRQCPRADKWSRCNHLRRGRYAANSLGIQLGVGLDLDSFGDEFYGGLFFEPVVGLNFGVGMALLKGDQLNNGYAIGQVVDPSQLGAYASEAFMARPYISISLSFDIIRNVRAAAKVPEVTGVANGD